MSWLEVLATPRKPGLPKVGECIVLSSPGPHKMGPAVDGQLLFDVIAPNRPHRGSGMTLKQLLGFASTNEVLLNGRRLGPGAQQPRHGDVVEILPALVLRYLERDEPKYRSAVLESAIGDAPEDEACWRVYSDWLLARGDALGHRMVMGPDGDDDDARWLGAMARPWRLGNLELTWRHGFIHSATVRALEWEIAPDTYWCLERLFELELCRFIEGLHVDLFTTELDGVRPPFETRARRILETLRHAPRTLCRVTLGPVMEMGFPKDLLRELAMLREQRPRLETEQGTLVRRFSRMVLNDGSGNVIALTEDETVHRFGIESLRVTLGKWGVAWAERVEPRLSSPFLANGRKVMQARLMPGDILEPAPGFKLKVEVA